jgi:O-antigen/teichoic acid export membrane protein
LLTPLLRYIRGLLPPGLRPLASAAFVSQAVTIAVLPLLTRWAQVSDFGLFQIYATVTTMGGMLACLRYDLAVLQPSDEEIADRLYVLSLIVAASFGILTVLVLPPIAWAFGTEGWSSLSDLRLVVGAAVALTGMSSAANHWLLRHGSFTAVARSRVLQSVGTASVQLVLVLSGCGALGLILGDAIGRAAGFAAMAWRVPALRRAPRSRAGITAYCLLGRAYHRFPLVSMPSSLLSSVGTAIPVFFIERFFGTDGLGIYALLERTLGVPVVLIGRPLSQTFIHRLRAALAKGATFAADEILSTGRVAAALGIAPYAVLLLIGPWLFEFAFGTQWRTTGELARALALLYYVTYAMWPVNATLMIVNRLSTQMAWDVGRGTGLVAVVVAVAFFQLSLGTMLALTATVIASFQVIHYVLCLAAAREGPARPSAKSSHVEESGKAAG